MRINIDMRNPLDDLETLQAIQAALIAGLHSVAETERIRDLAFVLGHEEKLREIGCLPVLSTAEDRTGPQIMGDAIHYVNDIIFDYARAIAEELRASKQAPEKSNAAA